MNLEQRISNLERNTSKAVPNPAPISPGRFSIIGHSYCAPPSDPYAYGAGASGHIANFQREWPSLIRNMLGIGHSSDNVIINQVPAISTIGNSATTFLGQIPEEAWIDLCAFVPNASTNTVAAPNGRTWQLQVATPNSNTASTIVYSVFNATWFFSNVTQGQQITMLAPAKVIANAFPFQAYRDSSGAMTSIGSTLMGGGNLYWKSTALGTGVADPGGIVYVRFNSYFRNYAVSSAQVCNSGIYNGGWATYFTNRPRSQSYYYQTTTGYYTGVAGEVNVNTTAASGATTIACDALPMAITAGSSIAFSTGNGATVTATGAVAAIGATSITVDALPSAVPAGSSGFAKRGGGNYETLTGIGTTTILHGINDCGQTTFDRNATKETFRALIANASCPYMSSAIQSNIVYAAGNGSGATWATHTQPGGGQFFNPQSFTNATLAQTGAVKMFSGAVGGTAPSITINIPPSFEGGAVDLFFLGLAGANNGGAANITIDGGSTVAAINTNNVSATGNQTTIAGVSISTTSLTGGTGAFDNPVDLGKFVVDTTTPANIPAGAYITALPNVEPASPTGSPFSAGSTTVATISASGTTSSSQSISLLGFTPMVKRLTGLTAGAHTIKITLTSIGSGSVPRFFFYGYGIEANSSLTPDLTSTVAVCNVPRIPGAGLFPAGSTTNTNAANVNIDLPAILAGTATSSQSGNTSTYSTSGSEPGFGKQAFIVELDALLGGASSSKNFAWDMIHPNARGHALIANAVYNGLISNQNITPINLAITNG